MNYNHAFHAGSFADVFKHVALCLVLEYLLEKEKPFCYLDTHAGKGIYNLKAPEAQKTKEYKGGIQTLLSKKAAPKIIDRYLSIVRSLNRASLQYYPGSPLIARHFLRPSDRLILTELHPVMAQSLKDYFKDDSQVAVHSLDGYQALKAFLPPNPRRGVVLIDPPYENKDEFAIIIKNITLAHQRWPQGIYLIWYPIKSRHQINQFERQLLKKGFKDLLMTELSLYPDDSPLALNGSGLAIINPPWRLANKLRDTLPWLLNALDTEKRGKYRIEQLAS